MKKIKVTRTVSDGIAMGKAYVVAKPAVKPSAYSVREPREEIKKWKTARDKAEQQLREMAGKNSLFAAHAEILKDEMLCSKVKDKIEHHHENAEQAVWKAAEEFIHLLDGTENPYIIERTADIKDVRNRVMCIMKNQPYNPFRGVCSPVIVIAEEITPSDMVLLDTRNVLGMITKTGGVTSHVSIMTKNMGLPALVGVKEILNHVQTGNEVILDALNGEVIIQPSETIREQYTRMLRMQEAENEELEAMAELPACTADGHEVRVLLNVGSMEEIKKAVEKHIYGVGLFRSENIYMESNHFPTEEEQFRIYKEAALLCREELTIRTLDIGGDKKLPYFQIDTEKNPFLGWRAIRISLDQKEMFKEQLRAVLRAGAYGNVRLMLPMVISVEELTETKRLVAACRLELKAEGKPCADELPIGIIIETPASVLLADVLALEADFFSIGTNDLTQYMLAVDRDNTKMAARYDAFHPAVMESIRRAIEAGHRAGIKVAMCGEMAGDEKAVPMLLQMGLDEFSVSRTSYAKVKHRIRQTTLLPE